MNDFEKKFTELFDDSEIIDIQEKIKDTLSNTQRNISEHKIKLNNELYG